MAVGCKCLLDMPKQMIDDRFGLVRDQGVAFEYVGVSMGVRGGVALYTNRDSVSVNMVCHIGSLGKSGITLYDMMNNFLEQPQMKKLLNGAKLAEYSAHAIPEGGYEMIPQLNADGFLICGDAAAFCNATGINLEGINMATHSGILAAKAVIAAKENKDYSKGGLDLYRKLIEESYVYKDLKTFKRAPGLLHDDRIFQKYPDFALDMIKKIYHITGEPKQNMTMLVLKHMLTNGKVSVLDLASTVWTAWRGL
jgi:electron transfer flavoprotein-quinone oxidoreductase